MIVHSMPADWEPIMIVYYLSQVLVRLFGSPKLVLHLSSVRQELPLKK